MNNEPNLKYNPATGGGYWGSDLKTFITNFQKPAYEVLHSHGEYVVSAAIAGSTGGVKTLVDNGLLSVTDAVAFHPYGDANTAIKSTAEHISKIQTVSDMIGNKPLFITEWNIHNKGGGSMADWAGAFDDMYAGIKGCVTGVWYYPPMVVEGTMAGPSGIFKRDSTTKVLSHNEPFYSALKAVFSKTTYIPPSTGGGGTGGGNTGGGTGGGGTGGGNTGGGAGGGTGGSIIVGGGGIGGNPPPTPDVPKTTPPGTDGDGRTDWEIPDNVKPPVTPTPTPARSPIVQAVSDFIPHSALVPCGNNDIGTTSAALDCDFNDLVEMGRRIINFLFFASVLLTVSLLVYTGYLYLSAGSDVGILKKVKSKFLTIIIGFALVLGAWLIINTLVTTLIDPAVIVNPLK
jgi:hypothetical protein